MAGWDARRTTRRPSSITLGANADFYGKFAGNAPRLAWPGLRSRCSTSITRWVNPPIDRSKPAEEVKDVYISIQKETDLRHLCIGRQGRVGDQFGR